MQNIISRQLISNNFVGTDVVKNETLTKDDLIDKINNWKCFLKFNCNAQAGESILLGIVNISFDYIALCFASAELSLKLVVVDYERPNEEWDLNYIDPKTKILSPIDIFIHDWDNSDLEFAYSSKINYFINVADRSYNLNKIKELSFTTDQLSLVETLLPQKDNVLMKYTTSGTTGTPKLIEHTHELYYKLAIRNSKQFEGVYVHTRNLHHGSTAAGYLFPLFASNSIKKHIIFNIDEDEQWDQFLDVMSEYKDDWHILFFAYPFMVDKFINSCNEQKVKWPNLNLHIISYIQDNFRTAVKDGVFNSISSIFGSNETAGPLFYLYVDKDNLNKPPTVFTKVDDFFPMKLYDDGRLSITLPVGDNKEIITGDVFEIKDGYYVHKGRSDLIRINGEVINFETIRQLNLKDPRFYVVSDAIKNCLYLVHWEDVDNSEIESFKDLVESNFNRVRIHNVSKLDKHNFFCGRKIDNELIREYFRKSF